ncbi:MAG: Crp/Fnr family transcriptional regulator [Pseudomonadota bacterium]
MKFSEFVGSHGRLASYEAGDHLFRQGDENRSVFVLREGLLKAYYLSAGGKENIKSFIQPGELIGSLAAAYFKEDCSFSVVCLEHSSVLELDFDALYAATREDLDMASAMVDHLLKFAMRKERRERQFLTESAEERYRMLLEGSPELFDKVTQKDIARYLGITPVALSRIRRRSS